MLSAARSMSPLKSSPSLMFKTPSLLNINLEDDSKDDSKDARIRELEETIAALRSELASVRTTENKREEEDVPTQPQDLSNTNGNDDQDNTLNTHDDDAIDDGIVTEDTINGTVESPVPHFD